MKIPVYIVNAFTTQTFGGNPAAVCPLEQWLPDELMAKIAAQHNLSETAFFVLGDFASTPLRWWTPTIEAEFCGHATLASAHVVLRYLAPRETKIVFSTRRGKLAVEQKDQKYLMTLPADVSAPSSESAASLEALAHAMGKKPQAVFDGANKLLVYASQQEIEALAPNRAKLYSYCAPLNVGVIATAAAPATAPGAGTGTGVAPTGVDFVSRFFAPAYGIDEDPVTGSAHCQLTPYWAARLGKKRLVARQLSARGGELYCELAGEQVRLEGSCVDFSVGKIELNL